MTSQFNWKNPRQWDNSGSLMEADGLTGRVRPGHSMRYRRTVYDWMFLDRDPKDFRDHETPDPVINIWLEEVFGEDYRQGRLKVAMHPHLGRWALYERHFDPYMGSDLYQCIFICSDEPLTREDGMPVIPSDYVGNPFLECFSTYVGEYRNFNRRDFEEIERFNRLKYGVMGCVKQVDDFEEAEEKEKKRIEDDKMRDFMDYYWNQAQADANQAAGCMSTTVFVQNPDRDKVKQDNYVTVDKGKYKIKAKKGSVYSHMLKAETTEGFMDDKLPRTTDEKSHVNDWEKMPKIEVPETEQSDAKEKVLVLAKPKKEEKLKELELELDKV